jgi:hypothetical protein
MDSGYDDPFRVTFQSEVRKPYRASYYPYYGQSRYIHISDPIEQVQKGSVIGTKALGHETRTPRNNGFNSTWHGQTLRYASRSTQHDTERP